MTSRLDERIILVAQIKKQSQQVDDCQLFERKHRNFYYRNETLRTMESNFPPTDTSGTYLTKTKLDPFFMEDFAMYV